MMQLYIEHISKSYGTTRALHDFCAELEPGVYALLGPNGAGKSTLMHIITDNLKPDAGRITFTAEGDTPKDIRHMGARFRARVGYMPQYPGMYPDFTVKQFIWYMAALKDVGAELPRKARKQYLHRHIAEILTAVGLFDMTHRKISALSGGMKQRLALAQAVLGDPDVLVLDEPTAGLDPKQRIAIRNFIARIALNKIVLLATHVMSDIEFIAKRVLMLKNGVLHCNATPAELTERMVGRVWSICVPPDRVVELQARLRVTAIATDDTTGNAVLRILSDARPTRDAVPVAPTPEDYYLYVYGETI